MYYLSLIETTRVWTEAEGGGYCYGRNVLDCDEFETLGAAYDAFKRQLDEFDKFACEDAQLTVCYYSEFRRRYLGGYRVNNYRFEISNTKPKYEPAMYC